MANLVAPHAVDRNTEHAVLDLAALPDHVADAILEEAGIDADKELQRAMDTVARYEKPTEFFEGEWHFPKADGPEPWAVITYTDEPSPETGHVGWCWWAMGSMGDAPSYEAARDAAVAEIQRLMDRVEVLP